MIFPFNQRSEDLATLINKAAIGDAKITVSGIGSSTNYMKDLVTEIKTYYDEKEKFAKGRRTK
jgi:hypothetical protein